MGSNCTRGVGANGLQMENPSLFGNGQTTVRYREVSRSNSMGNIDISRSDSRIRSSTGYDGMINSPPAVLLRRHSHYHRQPARGRSDSFVLKESTSSSSSLPIVSRIALNATEGNSPIPIPVYKQEAGESDATLGKANSKSARESLWRTKQGPNQPETLVHLCLRFICDNPQCWSRPDINEIIETVAKQEEPSNACPQPLLPDAGTSLSCRPSSSLQLFSMPVNLYRKLFEMLVEYRLLRLEYLHYFHLCWLEAVRLSSYPGLKDSWIVHIIQFEGLKILDLSNNKELTDDGFREVAHLGYGEGSLTSLNIEGCILLTDISVAPVLHHLSSSLECLNISKCSRLTDSTLSSLVSCRLLRECKLDGCKEFTSPYLCHLGLLTHLESLSLNMCDQVNDHVIRAFKPTTGVHQIINAAASAVSKQVVSLSSDAKVGCQSEHALNLLKYSQSFRNKTIHLKAYKDKHANFGLENLQALEIGWCNVTDEGCNNLLSFSGLKRLVISNCPVSSKGFSQVFKLTRLEHLEALYCEGIGENLSGMSSLSNLRVLKLDYAKHLRVLPSRMVNLRHLSLSNTSVGNDSLLSLSREAPLLQTLNIEATPVSELVTQNIAMLSNLERLDISDTSLGDTAISQIAKLPKLKVLILFHSNLSNMGARLISSKLHLLEELNLDAVRINDDGLVLLKQLVNLKRLDLFGANITDQGAKHLSHMENLEDLDLCGGRITNAGVKHLCLIASLKRLNVSQNSQINDEGLKYISISLVNLVSLNISLTGVSAHALLMVKNIKTLEELTARNLKKNVPATVVAQLLHSLPRLWHILV